MSIWNGIVIVKDKSNSANKDKKLVLEIEACSKEKAEKIIKAKHKGGIIVSIKKI